MNKKKFSITLIISVIVLVLCCVFIYPLINKTNYGLDLQGGFEVLYEVRPLNEGDNIDSDMIYSTYQALLKRIDILGVSEPEITIEGTNRIRVRLAGVTNIEEARRTISSTAVLSFRDYNDNLLMTSDVLGGSCKLVYDNSGRPAVSLNIKDTDKFYDVTKKVKNMTNNVIVIWLDYQDGDRYVDEISNCGEGNSRCLSAARVEQAFASDVIIQGNFTKDEAKKLTDLINSGALPTHMVELSSRTVEASFGENSLNKTLISGLIGIILVIILICSIYKFSGFIASIGLILYTFMSFLLFYLIGGVLTLPGIAAMILGIGMAVDSCIICFERIKENLRIGKSSDKAFEIGNKNSLSSIIDANVTTIIVAIILFILGESSVKGFATMLIISVVVTILVMVYLVRLILKLFVSSKVFDNNPYLFIGLKKSKIVKSKEIIIPYEKFNFSLHNFKFMMIAFGLILVGTCITLISKPNFGIDFTGGTSITINKYSDNLYDDIKNMIDDNYTIKSVNNDDGNINIVIDEVLGEDEINNLSNIIKEEYDLDSDIYVVSKVVKIELTKNAIKSLIFAIIGIVIYVSIRFKFNYAVSAIVALLHDVIITFLIFSVFKIEITSIFIAAILTIIGYSINDTIVTFDMIRENYKDKYNNHISKIDDLKDLVNISIRRCLYRTMLTTITTLLPVVVLMIFGAREIINFNVALFVGFIAGVYSSIFISNQIWYYLEKRKIERPKKIDDDDEISELKVKGINC